MPGAADQAQATAEASVHQQAVKVATEANKLARALQQVGADAETIRIFDEMANAANDIASAGVGNAPPANPGSDPNLSPPPDELTGAIQSMHNDMAAQPQ